MLIRKLCCLAALALTVTAPQLALAAKPVHEAVTPQAVEEKLAAISANPAKLADAIKNGQKSAQFCRYCHGVGGYSVTSDVPNLASQNAAYLAEPATIEELGNYRGQRLFLLEVHPVAYNPVAQTIAFRPRIEVDIKFAGGSAGFVASRSSHAQLSEPDDFNSGPVQRRPCGSSALPPASPRSGRVQCTMSGLVASDSGPRQPAT